MVSWEYHIQLAKMSFDKIFVSHNWSFFFFLDSFVRGGTRS